MLAMRVVALLGEGIPSFSVGGTLGILLMGAVLGAIGGLGFALVRRLLTFAGERQRPHLCVTFWQVPAMAQSSPC